MNLAEFGKRFGKFNTPNADLYSNGLLRLPLYPSLTQFEINRIIETPVESLEKDLISIIQVKKYTPNYTE